MPATQHLYRFRPQPWQQGWHVVEASGTWHYYYAGGEEHGGLGYDAYLEYSRLCDELRTRIPWAPSAGLFATDVGAMRGHPGAWCLHCWQVHQHNESLPPLWTEVCEGARSPIRRPPPAPEGAIPMVSHLLWRA